MIVADTNLIAYLMISGGQTELAERVLNQDSNWHAPVLWRSEFMNTLASYLRLGSLDLDGALSIMAGVDAQVGVVEHSISHSGVLRLVSESACSAYDCEFVALAQSLNVPLITSDSRILRDFPDVALAPDDFVT